MVANTSRKVELANDEMIVRSMVLTNRIVIAVIAIRLTNGMSLVLSL